MTKQNPAMYIVFAMKETSYGRYAINVPAEMCHASDEELREWLESGTAFEQETVEYIKHLDTIESEIDTDYQFEVARR